MTIPLDNLYDYIFSLTGHNNKNLIMYRFDPHGSKNIKNLICHNNIENVFYTLKSTGRTKPSWHLKLLFCFDQEPLDFDSYTNNLEDIKETFFKEGVLTHINNPISEKIALKRNIAGHVDVIGTIYDKKVLLHSEKNSEDLKKYEQNGFIGAYYWAHAFIALDWYRFANHDISLKSLTGEQFTKDFNIYSRAWTGSRKYRLKFLELLKEKNIDKKSNIFFNNYSDETHYSDAISKSESWGFKKENIDNLNCCISRNIDSSASATYNSDDYKESAIDVVLETVFDLNKIQLTEKILRPIACGKPFIVISEKGTLEYLKSYGFKTFNGLIDESYDNVSNPKERLNAIVDTMQKISIMDQKNKNDMFMKIHKIAEENKKWFFSADFFAMINDELSHNIKSALQTLDIPKYHTAKSLRLEYRAFRRYRKYLSENARKTADNIINEYPERIELSKKNIGKY